MRTASDSRRVDFAGMHCFEEGIRLIETTLYAMLEGRPVCRLAEYVYVEK
jgi:hypothetical protein